MIAVYKAMIIQRCVLCMWTVLWEFQFSCVDTDFFF